MPRRKMSEGSSRLAPWLPTAPLRQLLLDLELTPHELSGRLHGDKYQRGGSNIYRVLNAERISWPLADRMATALGYHPSEIWGFDWTAAA